MPDQPRPKSIHPTRLEQNVTLLDLLDRILDKGVIIYGDITISVADVDLVYVGLRVLLSSVETAEKLRPDTLTLPHEPE